MRSRDATARRYCTSQVACDGNLLPARHPERTICGTCEKKLARKAKPAGKLRGENTDVYFTRQELADEF